jgi:acetylornithine deacetylase/succinyl-diaminopimelate desuccinylase-like protein
MNRAADRVEQSRVRLLDQLFELLRIPSVSADPGRDGACRQAADWLRDRLRTIGCSVELLGSASHPVVHARGPDMPGRPTVLVYGHYDVQPPEPLDAWHTPPFTPTIRDGCIHARGATDDKGQLLALIATRRSTSAS